MRPRRVSNSLSDEVRAGMNDFLSYKVRAASLIRRGQGRHERFATVPVDRLYEMSSQPLSWTRKMGNWAVVKHSSRV